MGNTLMYLIYKKMAINSVFIQVGFRVNVLIWATAKY